MTLESAWVFAEAPLVTAQNPERSPCKLGLWYPGAVVMSPGGPPSPPTTGGEERDRAGKRSEQWGGAEEVTWTGTLG